MKKPLIATVLAASLALSSISTPAMADRAETQRAIVGIAALAIIAGALANSSSKKKGNVVVTRNPPPAYDSGRDRNKGHHDKWDDRKHNDRRSLPAACAFDIRTRDGRSVVLGKACLQKRYDNARKLPRSCEFPVRTRNGVRDVYGSQCLEMNGYRIEARR
ncbi:hypothetical protein [Frigidibacter sp. ROC022]|uniref:hypothetical protein n=1 Tax=Frigidibacter sp. ROC022 TaxID=2971796 RepID=UPI00215AAB80|nr:hypothetical protein [Frigidibacter sp. ROC022]MCR8724324.1 hypothetical protein [Frigidibacter sp. ROC022]